MNAGVPDNTHHLSPAVFYLVQQRVQGRELTLAADEPIGSPSPTLRRRGRRGSLPQELVDLQRCWLAWYVHRPHVLRMHGATHESCRGGAA